MVRLREVPRTATFAWSPDAGQPFLVTGTRAGAVDADFSDESMLELWDLALDDKQQALELQPVASIGTESKFYDIAWGPPNADHSRGIIAAALENGTLNLWDASKLISGDSDALISQTSKHTGAIKTLQFNPLKPQILATAGAKGEIYIYDVNDISNPFRLGNPAARSDDIESLAWNRKVSHILATGGSGGFVTVWDLKTKKASLTLNNTRKAVSAIAWDPNNSTKLLTATADDSMPVIYLWDLRNSNAPERTLQGHQQGVLSLSWCTQDSDLLLSSGKDNRTVVWNPQTGEQYGELPEATNWTFLTRFNPHNPNLSATASFDGKITIQTLQNTNPDSSQAATGKSLDDEEFFRVAQTQPQGASWSLSKAPKWLERPIGASFGFGGKLIIFKASSAQPGTRSSKVLISQFSVDSDISTATEEFQQALASGDLTAICKDRSEQAKTDEEKADWKVMETLAAGNPRESIVEYLGFNEEEILANGGGNPTEEDGDKNEMLEPETKAEKSKRLSQFFDGGEGEGDGEDFLSNLAANKSAKTDNPFHLFSDGDTSVEKDVTKALMLGNFTKATDICLKQGRMADAFLIANCGGQELVDRVQSAYLSQKAGVPSYMRLLGSVIAKNLWDVVYNADLDNWKETMAVICTFSDPDEFPDLCEALGDRVHEHGSKKDASFCYLAGSKLQKVITIWAAELDEAEQQGMKQASDDSTFSVHARYLQHFIEKVTIFREVTKFQDKEKSVGSGWQLATLYDKYTEYADILAGHGQLEVAQKYLNLLPSEYPAADIARNRVKLATKKPVAQAPSRQPAPSTRTASTAQAALGYQVQQPARFGMPSNPYGGMSPAPQPQQYMPPGQDSYPQQTYQPNTRAHAYFNPPVEPPPMSGPPRNMTPSGPPPSKAKNMQSWNDVPAVAKPPPRRSTPSMAPITSPFPGQQGPVGPPTGPYGHNTGPAAPPPPPKGAAPPRMQSPLTGPPRPSSSAANQYAPPPSQGGPTAPQLPPVVPRMGSPYNAPPAGAPPSSRYAPAPGAQQQQPNQSQAYAMHPPPAHAGRGPPPPNSYGAPPPQRTAPQTSGAPSPYGPPPTQAFGGPQAPPTGPPTGPPPMGRPGPPSARPSASMSPPPQAAPPPTKAKHPPGDRSHVPPNAQGLVDMLSQDMQRVAGKAPATFAPQVKDTQKRLNLLFDHLNNEELVQPGTIDQLSELAQAIQSKDYAVAQKLQLEIQRDKTDECGNWMVGIKRLISMSKATP